MRAARISCAGGWLAIAFLAVAACSPAPEPVRITGDHDGLVLTADVAATGESIIVQSVLRNERDAPVHVVPTQCGRVVDVELERTTFEPEGATWDGSVGAAKELVLDDQRGQQGPDTFHPRRAGSTSSDVPECVRPDSVTRLEPGAEIAERWELPFNAAYSLDVVGSAGMRIGLEAVEAHDPDRLEFLDVLQDADEDEARAGRVVRAELPASQIISRDPTRPPKRPSIGELFDRLVEDERLRSWIEAQPADSWGLATLRQAFPEYGADLATVQFRLLSKEYERAAIVIAQPDGSNPQVTLPDEAFRTRAFERRPGTLPPGVAVIPERDFYSLSDDLLVGEVVLPSGRVVVGEYLSDLDPLDFAVEPGSYPVHATLARYQDQDFDNVSFATLVVSDAPTERWEEAGTIAVDGGSTTIVSVEGRDAMDEVLEGSSDAWLAEQDVIFESLAAHDYLATEYDLTPELNLAHFTSGNGDGGYPVWIGRDAAGNPTRVVVDFFLLHLAWPGT
jgi:Protein of unknown function (DUF4241)